MTSSDDPYHRHDHTYAPLPSGVRVCDDAETAGDYFFYRDGELIVAAADYPLVERLLAKRKVDPTCITPTRSEGAAGLVHLRIRAFPRGWDTVRLVRSLRAADIRDEPYEPDEPDEPYAPEGRRRRGWWRFWERPSERRPECPPAGADLPARPPRVSFNHVLSVHSHTIWGSAVPPQPGPALRPLPSGENLPGARVRVGVLDTGITDLDWLRGRWTPVNGLPYAQVEDTIWAAAPLGELEYQVGHGTFVAGTVLRHAPGATVVVERMRDRHGCVDDWTVHSLLPGLLDRRRNPVDVLNLSFGGHTSDNLPLPAVCTVLDEFLDANPDVVVVASAGNEGDTRPVWPAALPRVVGVGALTADRDRWQQSNSGSWVNAWTLGVNLPGPFVRWPRTVPPQPGRLELPPNYVPSGPAPQGLFDGWAVWSGTSFAAARVSGAIAAELKRDSRTPRRVVSDLVDNATTRFESGALVSPAAFS